MPFASLKPYTPAHDFPEPAPFGWYWQRHFHTLRRILASGGWSVHDVINRPDIRGAVTEQWRLALMMQRERDVQSYIQYLEYLEDVSQELPARR